MALQRVLLMKLSCTEIECCGADVERALMACATGMVLIATALVVARL